jgi:hypothetical protein
MSPDTNLLVPGVIVSGAFSVGAFLIKLWIGRLQDDIQGLTKDVRASLDSLAAHNTRITVVEKQVEGLIQAHEQHRERFP